MQSVVFVWRLGQTYLIGRVNYGFSVRHDRVRHFDWNASVVFFQIFQADFQVQLASAGYDVLTRLFDDTLLINEKTIKHWFCLRFEAKSQIEAIACSIFFSELIYFTN